MSVEEKIEEFKHAVMRLNAEGVVRRHLIHGSCAKLSDDSYYDLRQQVSDNFSIHPNEIVIVGSAKLGFSIAPQKRYREFCDTSDIDLAIISEKLFSKVWKDIFYYNCRSDWNPKDFSKYLFKGWIRPDKIPHDDSFTFANEWFEYFMKVTNSGHFGSIKISGGIYKDWNFLETYHANCVEKCRMAEEIGK